MTLSLNKKTAYLTGLIIGDGNLSNYVKSKKTDLSRDYRITIDISDKKFVVYVLDLIKTLIQTRTTPKAPKIRGNRIPRLKLQIRNKELFLFFNEYMGIQKGLKSSVVRVPESIKRASKEIKRCFFAGYFDADGGFRGSSLGFTTASKALHDDLNELLDEFNVVYYKDIWINKKYDKQFYGTKLSVKEIDTFLNSLPFRNEEKLERIIKRFKNH